jgi:hypothetical protein
VDQPQSRSGRNWYIYLFLPELELRPLDRPARSQSLFVLPFPPRTSLSLKSRVRFRHESGQLSQHSDRLWDGRPGFNTWQGQVIVLFFTLQTGSEVQPAYSSMDTGVFPQGYSGRCVKLITHAHVMQRPRMVELYLRSPTRVDGVVLN